jgi:hypothetical protein
MATDDALEYEELLAQPYADCRFSAGFVAGHPADSLYLRLERSGSGLTTILLRPDEAAALAWCLTGALWSERMRRDGANLRRPNAENGVSLEAG